MNSTYSDLLIRINPLDGDLYPVDATLSDGSVYTGARQLPEEAFQKLLALELDPEAYGMRLSDRLFQGRIGTAYAVASGLARKQSAGRLRIRLLLAGDPATDIRTLKWERLCQLEDGHRLPLAISERTPFSRHTVLPREEPTPLDEPYIQLLIVVSSLSDLAPFGLVQLDVSAHLRRLAKALQDVLNSRRCSVTMLPCRQGDTLAPDVRQLLEAAQFKIVSGPATLDAIREQLRGQHVLLYLGHLHWPPRVVIIEPAVRTAGSAAGSAGQGSVSYSLRRKLWQMKS